MVYRISTEHTADWQITEKTCSILWLSGLQRAFIAEVAEHTHWHAHTHAHTHTDTHTLTQHPRCETEHLIFWLMDLLTNSLTFSITLFPLRSHVQLCLPAWRRPTWKHFTTNFMTHVASMSSCSHSSWKRNVCVPVSRTKTGCRCVHYSAVERWSVNNGEKVWRLKNDKLHSACFPSECVEYSSLVGNPALSLTLKVRL